MDDVRENDQCLFYVAVTIIVMAESKKLINGIGFFCYSLLDTSVSRRPKIHFFEFQIFQI
nr:unnamed protein product [uncultured bacterium]